MLILPSDSTEKHSLGIQFPKPYSYNKTLPKGLLDRIAAREKKKTKNDAFSWKMSLKGSDFGSAIRSP